MPLSRNLLCGTLAALTLPALAQDSGFYLGATLGAGKAKSEASVALTGQWSAESAAFRSDVTSAWSKDLDKTSTLVGIQAGYRHAFNSGVVIGGELSLASFSAKKDLATGPVPTPSAPSVTYDLTTAVELKQPMSFDVKLGYASGPHLPFISLGYARAKAEAAQMILSNGGYMKAGTGSETVGGFQWGVGYEFRFNKQWSGNAAFTSANLGDFHYDTVYLPGSSFTSPAYGETFTHKMSLTTIKVAVNYHF
ncbi:MAG TPA: outer membrane beta-barrel protein [Holophagaceae bacterium]|nr:outer membrane beta-barrel protein [Holophagaceae bacterium]